MQSSAFSSNQNEILAQSFQNLLNGYCEKCYKEYTNADYRWCKPCQINDLKNNFTNWTSGNKKIDGFIQKMQLKIDDFTDIIFEWIPYNQQFNDIKETGRGVYSAIWKDGSLEYDKDHEVYTRKPNKKVALKYLYNSQNIINEFLNEV